MSAGLHELDPTRRFSDRATLYVRYRPGYPDLVISGLLEGLGNPAQLRAADIGAGTGLSSRLLADRGVGVIAVEPNAAMRAAAEPHAGVRWHDGTAESTGLRSQSVDLVVCAQAFHWFRADEALAEFARILKPGGRVGVLWNQGDESDAFVRAYYDVVFNASDEARRVADRREYLSPFAEQTKWREEEPVRGVVEQSFDLEALEGRAMSASYVPSTGEGAAWVRGELRRIFAEHQIEGRVVMKYVTTLYQARKR